MGFFLDARSSVHSTLPGFPGTPLSDEPERFGIIGLQTQNVANPLVILQGTIGVMGEIGDPYTVEIVRGASRLPNNVVFTLEGTIRHSNMSEFVSFTTADLQAPPAPETVYTSYISGVSTTVRNGPESLIGMAFKV